MYGPKLTSVMHIDFLPLESYICRHCYQYFFELLSILERRLYGFTPDSYYQKHSIVDQRYCCYTLFWLKYILRQKPQNLSLNCVGII